MYWKQFDNLLVQIECEYMRLWEILSQFKRGIDNADSLGFVEFQYRLATQLRKIQVAYEEIVKEEKDLIRRKAALNTNWFIRTLKKLQSMKDTLRCLNYSGRSLGDVFAYFFYQFDFTHLDLHLEHEEVSTFPTRVGGIGELEFIKNCRRIPDHFIVYHGITNILRIGDMSLFNMKTLKLAALGELKTKRKDEKELDVRVTFIGQRERSPFTDIKAVEAPLENLASGLFDEARAKRQIRKMASAFPKEDRKTKNYFFYDHYHFKDIEELFSNSKKRRIFIKKVSPGLIYVCFRNHKSFKRRFHGPKQLGKSQAEFKTALKDLIIPRSEFNQLLHGSVLYNFESKPRLGFGVPPVYWSPLSLECLKALYFHEIIVVTVLNPANIFQKLREKGFVVTIDQNRIEITRPGKFGMFKTPGSTLKFYLDQILFFGQTENGIVDVICNFYEKVKDEKALITTKLELHPRHIYPFRVEKSPGTH